jgi:hypothetical protein
LTSADPDLVNRQLQSLARERHGRNTHALQVLYAIEGFLRRLSASGYRQQLVLKGAMLLAVLDARRVTKDADLSAHGIPNDEQSVARVVAEHPVVLLSEALAELPDRQRSYDALRQRASFTLAPPDRWTDLVADVIAFVDPLIRDDAGMLSAWDPKACRWT